MARTHSEINYKVSSIVINHGQKAPQPTEAKASTSSCCKSNTYIKQGKRNTNKILLQLFDPTENIYYDLTSQFSVQQLHIGGLPLVFKQNHKHTTQKQNRTNKDS